MEVGADILTGHHSYDHAWIWASALDSADPDMATSDGGNTPFTLLPVPHTQIWPREVG